MTHAKAHYHLPKDIEHHLAVLSKLYGEERQSVPQEIIVNAQVRVAQAVSYDNIDGGTYGHALHLVLPEAIYLKNIRQAKNITDYIRDELNKIHNIANEFIAEVFLEMAPLGERDWRRESGVLVEQSRHVDDVSQQRLWGQSGYRVFLSHKTEVKKETAKLKDELESYGVTCFVAHENIRPTKAWQDEIENAMSTMDAFVALLTEKFHDSLWTDQEVGYALARGVPIVAVKIGKDPYGFIGKFQALLSTWTKTSSEIVKILANEPRMLDSYIDAAAACKNFATGNDLAEILSSIQAISNNQANRLCEAYNTNNELRGSFGFNGANPRYYGHGLAFHLKRITGNTYQITDAGIARV